MNHLEYKEWIISGIDAIDAMAIMGVDKKKSPYSLYTEKINGEINRGDAYRVNSMEIYQSKLIKIYEMFHCEKIVPKLYMMNGYEFIRASVMANENYNEIIHTGILGKDDWRKFDNNQNVIPDKYFTAIQHQLMVSRADECTFTATPYLKAGHMGTIEHFLTTTIYPDIKYQNELLKEELKFWQRITDKKEYEL